MSINKYLDKMGFTSEEISFAEELDIKYSSRIQSLTDEYIKGLKDGLLNPYNGTDREESHKRAVFYINSVAEKLPEVDQYASRLMGWLNCIPHLEEIFKKHNIDDDIFYESIKDFSYKLKECKAVYNTFGLFSDWFFLYFDLRMFALGRLQYEISSFIYDKYSYGEFEIKKGDTVYFCHIPSSGKLTEDMCMESFQKAYEFFKPRLNGNIIPIISHTWLFYKPYADEIFPNGSNLKKFVNLFEIISSDSTGDNFPDAWRVFNKNYEGTTDKLPDDNTLRNNFIKYIKKGGDFGYGYGIILYNGETREIVNKQ